jgi:hypothetical protein
MDRETYLLHQTPSRLGKDLIGFLPLEEGDILYEPFRGEGAFYNHFPENTSHLWTEIEEGKDCEDFSGNYDWVITNPPFCKPEGAGRVNAWWYYLDKFSKVAKKGIAFLSNDKCFSTLTPKRMDTLKERGFHITKTVLCAVKKWRGRYYFLVFTKGESKDFTYLRDTY